MVSTYRVRSAQDTPIHQSLADLTEPAIQREAVLVRAGGDFERRRDPRDASCVQLERRGFERVQHIVPRATQVGSESVRLHAYAGLRLENRKRLCNVKVNVRTRRAGNDEYVRDNVKVEPLKM